MKLFFISLILVLFVDFSYSQGEIDEQNTIFYRNERTYGISVYTNGFGGDYGYSKYINASKKLVYDCSLEYIRNPKEVRKSNPIRPDSRRFVYGKQNSFTSIKGAIGYQNELYRKIDKGGVSVRYFYLAGPCLGILKPVYYEIIYPNDNNQYEKFNPKIHMNTDILGKGPLFKGLFESSILPGAQAKVGLCFEYSKKDNVIRAFEAGVIAEAYLKKVSIMANNDNQQILFSIYLTYRFGKVVSSGHLEKVDGAQNPDNSDF
jgi:hypothetical protein